MADVIINSGLALSNGDQAVKLAGFLASCPMPQVPDPENPGEFIDEYATTKEHLEAWLKRLQTRKLLKQINKGIDILNRESTQAHIIEL